MGAAGTIISRRRVNRLDLWHLEPGRGTSALGGREEIGGLRRRKISGWTITPLRKRNRLIVLYRKFYNDTL